MDENFYNVEKCCDEIREMISTLSNDFSYDFDCDECREKYEKIVNNIDKANEITDKAVNVVEDTKNSIKK